MGGTWSITADESIACVPVPTDATVNASMPLPENSIEYVRVVATCSNGNSNAGDSSKCF